MANVLNRTLSRVLLKKRIWCRKEYSILSYYRFNATLLNTSFIDRKFNNRNKIAFVSAPINHEVFMNYCNDKQNEPQKLTLFQKFKQMYRDYWYVLVPVHILTSTMWFAGFYYMAKSGFDIVHILESWHVSEKVVNPLRDSSMGYVAVAYACYKIATPARYTVTLGGTTISINYLKKWGYIKPVPSKERMKEILQEKKKSVTEGIKEKKENLIESMHETAEGIKEKKDNIIESVKKTAEKKKENLIESIHENTEEIKEKKDNIIESVKKTPEKKKPKK